MATEGLPGVEAALRAASAQAGQRRCCITSFEHFRAQLQLRSVPLGDVRAGSTSQFKLGVRRNRSSKDDYEPRSSRKKQTDGVERSSIPSRRKRPIPILNVSFVATGFRRMHKNNSPLRTGVARALRWRSFKAVVGPAVETLGRPNNGDCPRREILYDRDAEGSDQGFLE